MTEQQQHLVNLLNQRNQLTEEIDRLQNQMNSQKELFLKVQGAIEYLAQVGVTLPENEPEPTQESVEE